MGDVEFHKFVNALYEKLVENKGVAAAAGYCDASESFLILRGPKPADGYIPCDEPGESCSIAGHINKAESVSCVAAKQLGYVDAGLAKGSADAKKEQRPLARGERDIAVAAAGDAQGAHLGISFVDGTTKLEAADESGAFAAAGITAGCTLRMINGTEVDTEEEVYACVQQATGGIFTARVAFPRGAAPKPPGKGKSKAVSILDTPTGTAAATTPAYKRTTNPYILQKLHEAAANPVTRKMVATEEWKSSAKPKTAKVIQDTTGEASPAAGESESGNDEVGEIAVTGTAAAKVGSKRKRDDSSPPSKPKGTKAAEVTPKKPKPKPKPKPKAKPKPKPKGKKAADDKATKGGAKAKKLKGDIAVPVSKADDSDSSSDSDSDSSSDDALDQCLSAPSTTPPPPAADTAKLQIDKTKQVAIAALVKELGANAAQAKDMPKAATILDLNRAQASALVKVFFSRKSLRGSLRDLFRGVFTDKVTEEMLKALEALNRRDKDCLVALLDADTINALPKATVKYLVATYARFQRGQPAMAHIFEPLFRNGKLQAIADQIVKVQSVTSAATSDEP